MEKPRYPQWSLRERVLWAVQEWWEERTNAKEMLSYYELVSRVGDAEAYRGTDVGGGTIEFDRQSIDRHQAQVMSVFEALVNDRLIDAELTGSSKQGGTWSHARVNGLTTDGLALIGELPDPNGAIVQRMDALIEAIEGLQGVSEQEKNRGQAAAEEVREFVRALPPGIAVEVASRFFAG